MTDYKGFTYKGKPFFPIGAQVHNSSAYNLKELERAWKALAHIDANTVAIPVFWETVEPVENEYNFTMIREIIEKVRELGYKLILAWFGTWKNGTMKYAPEWVKKDKNRFKRVISKEGVSLSVLSSHCTETLEADKKAFAALVAFVRDIDREDNTVIAFQVENEPGIMIGTVRDYSDQAQSEFCGHIPEDLIANMEKNPESPVAISWNSNGRSTDNWISAFGDMAEEYFTAYSIAAYIDSIAAEGKRKYDILMYVNVWVDQYRWGLPGISYPAGGATSKVLDIWKWTARHIDIIAPDMYMQNFDEYRSCCSTYKRNDNLLFVPESGPNEANSRYMFEALSKYRAIGYFLFGAEGILDNDDQIDRACTNIAGSFKAASAIAGGLLRYRSVAGLEPVIQSEYATVQKIDFTDYIALAYFTYCHPQAGNNDTDWNWHDQYHKYYRQNNLYCVQRGRGIIIEADKNEFYVAGDGFRLLFLPRAMLRHNLPSAAINEYLLTRNVDYLSVIEGRFDMDGNFTGFRKRNGDESDFGIWVEPDVGVVQVKMVGY